MQWLASRCMVIDLDQCCFGARLPGDDLLFRKSTRVVTSGRGLEALRQRCQGGHEHRQLEGSFYHPGLKRWCARTKYSGEYPQQLCQVWARAVLPLLMADPMAWAKLKRELLY